MCFSTGIPSSARERESVQDLETIYLRLITIINDAHSFEDKPRLAHSVHHEGSALCSSLDCLDYSWPLARMETKDPDDSDV